LQQLPAGSPLHCALDGRQQFPYTPPSVGAAQLAPAWQQSDGVWHGPGASEQQAPCAEQLAVVAEPQQSLAKRHARPGWEHRQVPAPPQSPLQHWVLSVQPELVGRQQLPATHWVPLQQLKPEQVEPSGRQQLPWVQEPVQHGPEAPQLLPSRKQHWPAAPQLLVVHWVPASQAEPAGARQVEPLQTLSQQSVELPQVVPAGRQAPQRGVAPLRQRSPPQHSLVLLQPLPSGRQQVRFPPGGRASQAVEQQSSPVAQLETPGKFWQVA
jgi:hypothetical protein